MGTLSSAELNARQLLLSQLQDLHLQLQLSLAAAVCVGTIVAVIIAAQLVIQTVCQSTRGNKVSPLAP